MRCSQSFSAACPNSETGHFISSEITLDAFVSRVYLPHIKARKRSWAIDERIARQYLSPIFGASPLRDIKRDDVENWLQNILKNGLSPASCNRYLAVFKTICSFAQKHGYLLQDGSPCAGVSAFRNYSSQERYLSHVEAVKLMGALEKDRCQASLAIQLLLFTGARKSEILKARWEHINLEQRFITVPLSKSGRPRHIVLSDAAMAVIARIPRKTDIPWLFYGQKPGKPLSDVYYYWHKLRLKLGLRDVRIHDLRHTFASILVNAGHSLYEVQKILGHGDPRTTMRYAHLGRDSLVAAAEKAGGFFY